MASAMSLIISMPTDAVDICHAYAAIFAANDVTRVLLIILRHALSMFFRLLLRCLFHDILRRQRALRHEPCHER